MAVSPTPFLVCGRWLVVASAVITLALGVIRFATVARGQLPADYDLAYEGPQVATIDAIRRGENPYDPATYNGGRFVFTMYTPLYHELVAALPVGPTPFFTGRVVSLAAMITVPLLLCGVVRPAAPAATAAGLFMLLFPACMNAAFTKNDSLALALGAAAVAVMGRGRSDVAAAGAAILVLAAWFTKQSFIAPGLACGIAAAAASPRHRAVFMTVLVSGAILLGGGASWAFGRHVWWCIAVAGSNPWHVERLVAVLGAGLSQPAAIAILVCGGWGAWAVARDGTGLRRLAWPAYAAASTAVLLATAGKEGSSTNYLLEPAVAWLGLFVQQSAGRFTPAAESPPVHRWERAWWERGGVVVPLITVAAMAAVADVASADRADFDLTTAAVNVDAGGNRRAREAALIRLAGHSPRILNLGWGSLTAELPGDVCLSDPLLQLLAYDARVVPVAPLLAEITARRFDLVVMYPNLVSQFAARQGVAAEVCAGVATHYRCVGQVADVFAWVPR